MKDGIYLYKRECVRRDDLNRKVKAFEEAIVEIYTEESDEITRFVSVLRPLCEWMTRSHEWVIRDQEEEEYYTLLHEINL